MHDAWGISDHAFDDWLVVAATVVVVAAMAYRVIAFRGRRVSATGIDADHMAFLAGGPRLAMYAVLGELRGAGVVGVNPARVVTRTAPLLVDATALDWSVYEAVAGGDTAERLTGHPR